MEELKLHGIEYFTPYILENRMPPMDLIAQAKKIVGSIQTRYNLSHSHALEDVVRSITNGAKKAFKKEVRLWKVKSSQKRKSPLALSELEKDLAVIIDKCDETKHLERNSSDTELTTVHESTENNSGCLTHKKDCRTWLYKSSTKRQASGEEEICEWYKEHYGEKQNKILRTSSIEIRIDPLSGGDIGDGQIETQRQPMRSVSRQKVRFSTIRAPDSSSENSSDDENKDPQKKLILHPYRNRSRNRPTLNRVNNFTRRDQFLSQDSDPEEVLPPQEKISRLSCGDAILYDHCGATEINISKTVSDVQASGVTPSNSDVSSRSSNEWRKIEEADEILARKLYDADLQNGKMESYGYYDRSDAYIVRSTSPCFRIYPPVYNDTVPEPPPLPADWLLHSTVLNNPSDDNENLNSNSRTVRNYSSDSFISLPRSDSPSSN